MSYSLTKCQYCTYLHLTTSVIRSYVYVRPICTSYSMVGRGELNCLSVSHIRLTSQCVVEHALLTYCNLLDGIKLSRDMSNICLKTSLKLRESTYNTTRAIYVFLRKLWTKNDSLRLYFSSRKR